MQDLHNIGFDAISLACNDQLTADIALANTGITTSPEYAGWRPLANFHGILDGNDKTISKLHINHPLSTIG